MYVGALQTYYVWTYVYIILWLYRDIYVYFLRLQNYATKRLPNDLHISTELEYCQFISIRIFTSFRTYMNMMPYAFQTHHSIINIDDDKNIWIIKNGWGVVAGVHPHTQDMPWDSSVDWMG